MPTLPVAIQNLTLHWSLHYTGRLIVLTWGKFDSQQRWKIVGTIHFHSLLIRMLENHSYRYTYPGSKGSYYWMEYLGTYCPRSLFFFGFTEVLGWHSEDTTTAGVFFWGDGGSLSEDTTTAGVFFWGDSGSLSEDTTTAGSSFEETAAHFQKTRQQQGFSFKEMAAHFQKTQPQQGIFFRGDGGSLFFWRDHDQDVNMQTVLLRIRKHYVHETQIVLLGNRVY